VLSAGVLLTPSRTGACGRRRVVTVLVTLRVRAAAPLSAWGCCMTVFRCCAAAGVVGGVVHGGAARRRVRCGGTWRGRGEQEAAEGGGYQQEGIMPRVAGTGEGVGRLAEGSAAVLGGRAWEGSAGRWRWVQWQQQLRLCVGRCCRHSGCGVYGVCCAVVWCVVVWMPLRSVQTLQCVGASCSWLTRCHAAVGRCWGAGGEERVLPSGGSRAAQAAVPPEGAAAGCLKKKLHGRGQC